MLVRGVGRAHRGGLRMSSPLLGHMKDANDAAAHYLTWKATSGYQSFAVSAGLTCRCRNVRARASSYTALHPHHAPSRARCRT